MMKKGNIDTALSDQQIVRELQRTVEKKTKGRKMKSFFSTIIVIAALLVLITSIWFPIYHVIDQTLEPKLKKDQVVLTSRIWNFSEGDIAAIKDENQITFHDIVAIPGDLIDIDKDGRLLVNKKLCGEIFPDEATFPMGNIIYPYQLPKDYYLTIADYSTQSGEVKVPTVSCIRTDCIAGKVLFCIWPFLEAGYMG